MADFVAQNWTGWASALTLLGITTIFTAGYRRMAKRVKRQGEENNAVRNGMCALIRDRIIEAYNRALDRGYCPIYVLENVNALYKEYKVLGGNGTVRQLIEKLEEMPTQKRVDRHENLGLKNE